MHGLRLLLPAAIVLVSCLPERDNPYDPAVAPAARLKVVDRTDVLGACLTVDTNGAWPEVLAASRGRCLALDARETTDPQSDLSELTFEFHRLDAAALPIGTALQMGPSPLALLPPEITRGFPVGSALTFTVVARDRGGARGAAVASLQMTNRRPIAVVNPPRTLPVDGYPWQAPGTPISLTFDGRASFDPDGPLDEIAQWCWTPPGLPEEPCTTQSTFSVSIPTATAARHVVRLRVIDGVSDSFPASSVVAVGPTNVWGEEKVNGDVVVLSRIDATTVSFGLLDVLDISIRPAGGGNGEPLALWSEFDSLHLSRWPEMTLKDTELVDDLDVLHLDPASTRLWAIANETQPLQTLYGFDVDLAAGDPIAAGPVVSGLPLGREEAGGASYLNLGLIATDSASNVWLSAVLGPRVLALSPAGAALPAFPILPAPGNSFSGLAAQPGTPFVWSLETRDIFQTASSGAFVRRMKAIAGGVEAEEYALPNLDAYGLSWIDGGRFWVGMPGRGLCLVDEAILRETGSFEVAIEAELPLETGVHEVTTDPVTGRAWWRTFVDSVIVTDTDGRRDTVATDRVLKAVDPSGATVSAGFGGLARGFGFGTDGLLLRKETFGFAIASDEADGGAWVSSYQPVAIQKFAEDGRRIDYITEYRDATGVKSIPILVRGLSADPSGYLYVFGVPLVPNLPQLIRLDLSAPREVPNRVPGTVLRNYASLAVLDSERLFTSLPPPTGGGIWVIELQADPSVILVTPAGAATVRATVDPLEGNVYRASTFPGTGDVCLVTQGDPLNGSRTFFVRTIPPQGAVVLATSMTIADSHQLTSVGARRGACWVALTEVSTSRIVIVAYDPAGNRIHEYEDLEGPISEIHAVSRDSVWLLREPLPGSPLSSHERLDFPVGGGPPIRTVAGSSEIDQFARP